MNFFKHSVIAVLSVGILGLTACEKEDVSPTQSETSGTPTTVSSKSNSTGLSGQELFKGIFFGQGPVTQEIPELASVFNQAGTLSNEEQNEFNAVMNNTMTLIQNENPNFYASFKSGIESGDHFEIDATMEYGAEMLAASMSRVQQYADPNTDYNATLSQKVKNKTGFSQGQSVSGDIAKAQNEYNELYAQLSEMPELELQAGNNTAQLSPVWIVLAAVVAVAAVEVAVVVDMAYWFSSVAAPSEDSVLKKEMIINSIANNLAANPTN